MPRLRVVVVDDTPDLLQLMIELLELIGDIEVVAMAHDGREAISVTRAYDPDLILMDINMPRMNGLSATLCIKQMEPAAKILLMSSDDSVETRIAAHEVGADGFLPKSNIINQCGIHLRRLFPKHYRPV